LLILQLHKLRDDVTRLCSKERNILPVFSWNDVLANVRLVGAADNTDVVLLIEVVILLVNRSSTWLEQKLYGHRIIIHFLFNTSIFNKFKNDTS